MGRGLVGDPKILIFQMQKMKYIGAVECCFDLQAQGMSVCTAITLQILGDSAVIPKSLGALAPQPSGSTATVLSY